MLRPENREHTGFIDESFQYICDGSQGHARYSGNYFSYFRQVGRIQAIPTGVA